MISVKKAVVYQTSIFMVVVLHSSGLLILMSDLWTA